MEGPGGKAGITSKNVRTPYRPIIAAPAGTLYVIFFI